MAWNREDIGYAIVIGLAIWISFWTWRNVRESVRARDKRLR